MFQPRERVVVAVSGGVDSMVLLRALYELRGELQLWLGVAHLDHRLRPNSYEDARLVADYARSLKLPLVQEAIDVPTYIRRHRLSKEEGARQVRYRFLAKAAGKLKAKAIALGHNLNDRVETFFLNLLRGSGLEGLAGMPPVRVEGEGGLRYIRPLIECSREEIYQFAQERGLPWREDPTNRDKRFLRNRLRWELLPLLRKYNPNALEAVARAEEILHKANEYLKGVAGEGLKRALLRESPQEIRLDRRYILAQEDFLQEQILREAIRRIKGDLQGIESVHVGSVLNELKKDRSGTQVTLPGRIRFVHQGRQILFTRNPLRKCPKPYCFELHMDENSFPEIGWGFELIAMEGSHPLSEDPLEARIDRAKIVWPLCVRNRRSGDRFEPLGLGGTKKLQDLFVDAKIPREERDEIPLVCDQQGILWVVGLRLSERGKVTPSTHQTLCIRARRLKG